MVYIRRIHDERLPRTVINWEVERRGRRPLESWMKEVKRNMTRRGLQEEDI